MNVTATPIPRLLVVAEVGGPRVQATPVPVDSLEAIAGPPAGMITTSTSVRLSGFGQYGDRSLYVVYDTMFADNNFNRPARLGGSIPDGSLQVQTTLGGTGWRARFDFSNGDTNKSIADSTWGVPGRHAVCVYVADNMTVAGIASLYGTPQTGSFNPGDGMEDNPQLQLSYLSTSAMQPRVAAAWPAVHAPWQQAAILAWLWRDTERRIGPYTPPA